MKTKKLLQRIADVLSGEASRKRREAAALTKLIEKLKAKEEELAQKRKEADDAEKIAKLDKKLALLRAQREKGEELLAAGSGERTQS